MKDWQWWTLFASVFVALAIMFGFYFYTKKRIKNIQSKYQKKSLTPRKDLGELLWKEKEKSKNPVDDLKLEFAINTIMRNKYKTFNVIGNDITYEKKTFEKIAKAKFTKAKCDFILIKHWKTVRDYFFMYYNHLRKNGMIFILNLPKWSRKASRLISNLKNKKIRFSIEKINGNILLVVK